MELQERYDDLYNLSLNLQVALDETNIKTYKEDIQDLITYVSEELEEIEKELDKENNKIEKQELKERDLEYRQAQGF